MRALPFLPVMVAATVALSAAGASSVVAGSSVPSHAAKARCKYVVKNVHGRRRRVRVCRTVKPLQKGATIAANIPIPNDGPVAFGAGSVWVIDREDGRIDDSGVPLGSLYRVDPATNAVAARIPGVVGGDLAVDEQAVWVPAGMLRRLLRVDLATQSITRIETTADPQDFDPAAVTTTPGAVWAANLASGTVTRLDAATAAITDTLVIDPPGSAPGGPRSLVSDGSTVWLGDSHAYTLDRIDATSRLIEAHIPLGSQEPCSKPAITPGKLWEGNCGSGRSPLFEIDTTTTRVVRKIPLPNGADAGDSIAAFGSVWTLGYEPNELVRIDPQRARVVGRLRLPGGAWTLVSGANALWVRVGGALLRIEPMP